MGGRYGCRHGFQQDIGKWMMKVEDIGRGIIEVWK